MSLSTMHCEERFIPLQKKNHKDNNTKRPEIIDCLQAFFSIINVNERDSKVRVYILYRVKNTIA